MEAVVPVLYKICWITRVRSKQLAERNRSVGRQVRDWITLSNFLDLCQVNLYFLLWHITIKPPFSFFPTTLGNFFRVICPLKTVCYTFGSAIQKRSLEDVHPFGLCSRSVVSFDRSFFENFSKWFTWHISHPFQPFPTISPWLSSISPS